MSESSEALLKVENVVKTYPAFTEGLWPRKEKIYAVNDVSLEIIKGETLGLVGESGSGKSTLGRQIVALEKPDFGKIIYKGQDLVQSSSRELKKIRREVQMVFQDPNSSLNPRKHIREILADPMIYHGLISRSEANERCAYLLDLVGLPKNSMGRYPHEFSGGQRQRLGIARAIGLEPSLIVLDEPVSALDVSIQAQILNLLEDLQEELSLTYLFIAHGLGAVHYISDRIAVMYQGKVLEIQDAETIFQSPQHEYTKQLIAADPMPNPDANQFRLEGRQYA